MGPCALRHCPHITMRVLCRHFSGPSKGVSGSASQEQAETRVRAVEEAIEEAEQAKQRYEEEKLRVRALEDERAKLPVAGAAGAMAAAVAASNYLVLFPINDWFTAGTLSYPVTFLLTDVTNRSLGKKAADRVVLAGFVAAMPVSWYLSGPRIAIASGAAYLTSQLLDVRIFDALRHRAWWVAPLVSTSIASALDSSLFVTIAFLGEPLPWVTWGIGDFFVKISMGLVMLLPFRALTSRMASSKLRAASGAGGWVLQGRSMTTTEASEGAQERGGDRTGSAAGYRMFVPTREWQLVEPDHVLPAGLEITVDVSSGERKARLPLGADQSLGEGSNSHGPSGAGNGGKDGVAGRVEREGDNGVCGGDSPKVDGEGHEAVGSSERTLLLHKTSGVDKKVEGGEGGGGGGESGSGSPAAQANGARTSERRSVLPARPSGPAPGPPEGGRGARAFSTSAIPRPEYVPDVQVDDFDYDLPAERIASRPCEPRYMVCCCLAFGGVARRHVCSAHRGHAAAAAAPVVASPPTDARGPRRPV